MFKSVVVIGCGGIGSHLIGPLVQYLCSLGVEERPKEMTLIDGDSYEESNLDRQSFHASKIGQNKADVQAERLNVLYTNMMDFFSADTYLGEENVSEAIPEGSVVFMGVDNHVCRRIVSKHCQTLENVILITGANELTDGNVQVFVRLNGEEMLPPIESRHPEIATTEDGDRSQMSCEELAQLPGGGQIIFTNLTAANIMLQLFWRVSNKELFDVQEIYFDLVSGKTRAVPYAKSEAK
jgi:molybdopterin/thiamine biosynthesis adenylyltransferase